MKWRMFIFTLFILIYVLFNILIREVNASSLRASSMGNSLADIATVSVQKTSQAS